MSFRPKPYLLCKFTASGFFNDPAKHGMVEQLGDREQSHERVDNWNGGQRRVFSPGVQVLAY